MDAISCYLFNPAIVKSAFVNLNFYLTFAAEKDNRK